MTFTSTDIRGFVADRLVARNAPSRTFFDREAGRIALASREMAGRFRRGGRLLAFGRGACATDAQHISVEFVHPVIVGKRALPALDLSSTFDHSLSAVCREHDMVFGFSGPPGDSAVTAALAVCRARGGQTFALTGHDASLDITAPSSDPFVTQEIVEVVYHTLWETVHVFLEHDEHGHEDVGASAFLYPFLGDSGQDTAALPAQVAASIQAKARDDERLREDAARDQVEAIADAAVAVRERVEAGGTLFMFGNGGSATDASDWAIDCASASAAGAAVPAISLAAEPAIISAVANDIGAEAIFLRQVIAHGRPGDVAIAISTSGGSANVIAALEEARKRRMLTVALLGYDGGEIVRRGLADLPIVVRCDYIPRIQEVQASIYHVLTEAWRQWRT